MKKVLFILKRRHDYSEKNHTNIGLSTGLYNSASFVCEMLIRNNIDSAIEVAIDNNSIDRLVAKHKPTHVIIEALWVTPSKFHILTELHPDVKWIIRLHSETPFLSNEGIAFDWLGDYISYDNVSIAVNSPRILDELNSFLNIKFRFDKTKINQKLIYLPNFYPYNYKQKKFDRKKDYIDVACFGAIRPMKNHIIQAIAALKFAESVGKKLRFHINSGRIEQRGENIVNNLKGIFGHVYDSGHLLINHKWQPRDGFLETCSNMDIGMQVSFSETFNIVGADLTSKGIPVVGSEEIPWLSKIFSAKPTNANQIFYKLMFTYYFPRFNNLINQYLLYRYTKKSEKIWVKFFKNEP